MEAVYLFIERGGEVIYPIMFVVLMIWMYLFERVLYLRVVHPKKSRAAVQEWNLRRNKQSWHSRQIHADLLGDMEIGLNSAFPTIRMLVSLCPLLGLLGTVTGMIEVFDVMVHVGGGSPKAMASGISKAILSTVAGMVGAISGLLALHILQRVCRREQRKVETLLAPG